MGGLAEEQNLDVETRQANVEIFTKLVKKLFALEAPPDLACQSNHDGLPEKEKDTETPVNKRKYKPRGSPQTQALFKKYQAAKYSDQVKGILARLEKDRTLLKNIFEMMKDKNIKINKENEGKLNRLSRKINKIENNIKEMNEQEASQIQLMDIEIKKLERKEEQAKTKMNNSIQNKSDLLEEAKVKAKQNKKAAEQRAKEEEDKFNREIQKIKDDEVKLETDFKNDLEAKKNELANTRDQIAKNNKRMTEELAKTEAEIRAKIQKLQEDEARKKEENTRKIENLKADIKYYNDKKARREREMNLKLIEKNKLKESIEDRTKKLSCIEADIKALQKEETQVKFNLDGLAAIKKELEKKVKTMEQQADAMRNENKKLNQKIKEKEQLKFNLDGLAATQKELEKKVETMEQQADAMRNENKKLNQKIKEKKKEIDKHTKERENMLEVEVELENRIVAQQEEQKKMQDKNKMKRKLDPQDNELAKKKAGNLEYITANLRNNAQAKTNTESDEAKERQQQEETCEQIQIFVEAMLAEKINETQYENETMRDIKTGKRNNLERNNEASHETLPLNEKGVSGSGIPSMPSPNSDHIETVELSDSSNSP